MSEHTPGPWGINKYGGIGAGEHFLSPVVVCSDGNPFQGFYAFGERNDLGAAEVVANRALIAASPELLAALRGLLEAYDEPLDDERARAEAARAAISKAESGGVQREEQKA